jgi:hypothetical protein
MQLHLKDWTDKLLVALWDYDTTWRNTIGFTPYEIVYGKNVILPTEFEVNSLRIALQLGMDLSKA